MRMPTNRTNMLLAVAPCLLIMLAVAATPAGATEKVWGFKGAITSYESGGGFTTLPDAPVGTVVRGQFRFEDTEIDLNGASDAGSYPFIVLALAVEGTSLLHLAATTTGTIVTEDDVVVGLDFRDSLGLSVGLGMIFGDLDLSVLGVELDLTEVAGAAPTVLTSDALPAIPPDLIEFTTLRNLNIIGYTNGFMEVANMDVTISEFEEPGTIDLPVLPDSITVNADGSITWTFTTLGISLCVSGCWVDPPVSTSFTYSMTNSARFTTIADFPTGFTTDFDVSVGGSSIGTFGPGDTADFTGFSGGGVTEFVISGIDPGAELNSAEAFPLELTFDSAPAEFTMTSAPTPFVPSMSLPGAVLLVGLLIGVAARVRRQWGVA